MELKPLYQKSFYGKAEVKRKGDAEILYSYGTPVLAHINGNYFRLSIGKMETEYLESATTLKHVKAFSGLNKRQYTSLPSLKEGI